MYLIIIFTGKSQYKPWISRVNVVEEVKERLMPVPHHHHCSVLEEDTYCPNHSNRAAQIRLRLCWPYLNVELVSPKK